MSDTWLDFILGGIVGVAAWFFGGLDGFVKVLLALSVIDYISGVAVAWVERRISSRVGFKGILKKCVMFSLVGVANLIDKQFLGGSDAVRTAVVLFYVGNEGLSIMENAFKLDVPFPKALQKHFLQFRTEDNNKDKEQDKEDTNDKKDKKEDNNETEDDTPEA